jgi:hypothetical protein
MDNKEQEFKQRAAFLADALSQLPPDAVTLSALCDLAVSGTIAVALDPSTARLLFENAMREYHCNCGTRPTFPGAGRSGASDHKRSELTRLIHE